MLRKAVPIFSHTFFPRRNIVRDCAWGSIAENTLRSATEDGRLQSRELSRARPGGARVTGCDSPPPLYTKATRRYRWVSARVSVFPVPIWKKPRDPRIPAGDETTESPGLRGAQRARGRNLACRFGALAVGSRHLPDTFPGSSTFSLIYIAWENPGSVVGSMHCSQDRSTRLPL